MKKRFYIISLFLLVITLGFTNVKAQTIGVNDETEFMTTLEDASVYVVKLESDLTLTERNMYLRSNSGKKTLDLNGYTLTYNDVSPHWAFQGNHVNFEFELTDSSSTGTGHFINTSKNDFLSIWISNTSGKFTLRINKGKYESLTGTGSMFFIGASNPGELSNLDIIVDDAVFSGNSSLFRTQGISFSNNVNMILGRLSYFRYPDYAQGQVVFASETVEIGSLFNSSIYDLYRDNNKVTDLTTRVADVRGYTKLEIVDKIGLVADPITLLDREYGYSASYHSLNIANNSLGNLELVEVRLSNDTNFEIVGTLPSTIFAQSTNNSLQLKVKEGAEVGTYTTTITGVDSLGNEYDFGTVSFTVNKIKINPTVTINNWTYGDTPNDFVVTNNPSDGKIVSSWYDSNGNNLPSKPVKPGEYEVSVTVGMTDHYDQFNVRVPFEIYKKGILVNSISITDKYYDAINPGLAADQVIYELNVPGISFVRHIASNFNSTGLYVGSDTAKVWIKIDEEFHEYYEFVEGGNPIEYEVDVPYNILQSIMGINLLEAGLDNSETTPAAIRPGKSIDLNTLFELEIPNYKNTVEFSLLDPYTGVSINGNLLQTEAVTPAGVVGIRIYFPALDINSDGVNEYGENFKDIYIRVTPKEELLISGLNNNEEFVYDGSSKKPTGTLLIEDDKVDISELEVLYEGVGTTNYNSSNPPINAGVYKVTYKIPDSNEKYYGSVTYVFEILKSNPAYVLPTNLFGIVGNQLNSISLPVGFAWKNENHVMDVLGNRIFLVTYTPQDTDNYNVIEDLEVIVYVKGLFNVNTNSLGNGSITPSVSGILEGSTITIKFTPDLNYIIDEVLVNGNPVTVTNNELIIEVNEDLNIEVSFRKITFIVNVMDFDTKGLNVNPHGTTVVEHGDNIDISIEVKEGYNLLSVKVNGIDKKDDLVSGVLSIENITSNYQIEILVEKIKDTIVEAPKNEEQEIVEPEKEIKPVIKKPVVTKPSKKDEDKKELSDYKVLEGAGQKFITKSSKDAKFKFDADYDLFLEVYVDNELLGKENYQVLKGSTVIVLKKKYLNTLSEGTYNLKVLFKDEREAKTTFVIANQSTIKDSGNKSYILVAIIALIGVITTGIIYKRKSN